MLTIRTLLISFLYCIALIISEACAAPSIAVGSMIDYIETDKSTLLKNIRNNGSSTAFIKIITHEIEYYRNGTYTEKENSGIVELEMNDSGLIVSPLKLVVHPQGQQSVRYVYRGKRDKERYYRIRYIPVLANELPGESTNQVETGIQVVNGFGTILIVRPSQITLKTNIHSDNKTLNISNEGNSTVLLKNFKECSLNNKTDCTSGTTIHIRPGTNKKYNKSGGKNYTFELIEGSQSKLYSF